ncbi:hypothetical protein BU15DRAFT_45453 [Melanogaster broomeanus]|nr:hypothetical protein BU15DRAFT_45453 [Melanogaster broomeanus]
MQAYANGAPVTNAEGYTLSSTYVPGAHQTSRGTSGPNAPLAPPQEPRAPSAQHQTTVRPITNPLTYGSWYQPGNCRCTRPGCPFAGSRKAVEIHMMDRHFVFPPGWEERRKDDWDADPSLKGKPVPIQGTSLLLDSPAAVDAWMADRRKRFPTADKVEDKKRKLEEAAARGQLAPEDMGMGARKKRKQDDRFTAGNGRGSRGQDRRGRAEAEAEAEAVGGEARCKGKPLGQKPAKIRILQEAHTQSEPTQNDGPESGHELDDDDDEAPEVVSSKVPVAPIHTAELSPRDGGEVQAPQARPPKQTSRPPPPQPKKPPRNPFGSRPNPTSLLLPEIRITVSNLSQAIRFLVDNDFLRDVELRSGEAQEKLIEVIGSSEAADVSPIPVSPEVLAEQHTLNPL